MQPSLTLPGGGLPPRPPAPPGQFLIGNLLPFKRDMLGFLAHTRAELGDVFRVRLGRRSLFIFSHPDFAEQVLIKERDSFGKLAELGGEVRGLPLVLGRGLVVNFGESWKRQRQMMQPIFHKAQIALMATAMTDAGTRLLDRWQQRYAPGAQIDVAQEMMRVTVDIVSQTMFGSDLLDRTDELGKSFTALLRYAFASFTNPLMPPPHWPTPGNRHFRRMLGQLDEMIYEVVDRRVQSRVQHGDLLDMLLAARDDASGEGMPIRQLRDEIATIFGAGHETTANALTWAFYLLSLHPDAAARLRAELAQVLGGRTPVFDDLARLSYTRAVFEESMRLYPPAPVLPRAVLRDTTVGGYLMRHGDRTMTNVHLIHRHPAYWEAPERFDPARFLPPQSDVARHRCAYLPFGAGPRVCIGNHFAMMEGQLLLAQILQRYRLTLVSGHQVEAEVAVTMRPRHGMRMTLQPV